ncbi:MAG: hypothetical protein DRI84_04130 [Bacteroidetes bacterium]|nr:MAG: hypothetical protein DRI84_04130 [Bacteroidota bacterium]
MSIAILTANNPDELHAFKSVLENNNIRCEIRQESIQAHQFYSTPGFKLYIDDSQYYNAQAILSHYGNTQHDAALNIGVEHSTAELELKGLIRQLSTLEEVEEMQGAYQPIGLTENEVATIFQEEKAYIIQRAENKFDWNEFLAALFEGRLFKYLNRNKSVKYQIEQELIRELEP